jgi:hypothetical protein
MLNLLYFYLFWETKVHFLFTVIIIIIIIIAAIVPWEMLDDWVSNFLKGGGR